MTFIDFKKPFDSIHHGKLMKILRAYGIPACIVKLISDVYDNTSAKVLTPDGETDTFPILAETDTFPILAGVLQGEAIAPYLFIVVLDYALRRATTGKEVQFGFTITTGKSRPVIKTNVEFADDIALVSDSVEKAPRLCSVWRASARRWAYS